MHYRFGLIGYPIKHSLSPWIHEQFFNRTQLQGDYSIIEIDPAQFGQSIAALKSMELNGFNVTAPFKQYIIDYLDDLDDNARTVGAVNTVRNDDGRWIGYNTDGKGYLSALQSKFPHVKKDRDQTILILGAGGAAKGIYHACMMDGYENVTIANRTKEKAEKIAFSKEQVITIDQAEETLSRFDIIIQTTSVGMKPNINQSIIDVHQLHPSTIVSDIVYQPIMTKLLQQAKNAGAPIHFGHTMLLYQAQYAFHIWTGKEPNMTGLDEALQQILEG